MSSTSHERKRRKKLYTVFTKIKHTGGTLIIGGDFFDFWFEYRDVAPKDYCDIFVELEELYKSGIQIHYVLGNHDYWDFGYFSEKFGAKVYRGNMIFTLDHERILLTHGDGILKNDMRYRLLKRVIRNPINIALFKNFHPDWGCWIARKVSKRSGDYHHHHSLPEAGINELQAYARKQWQLGIQTVLMGHYHQVGITTENEKRFIHLGDWLSHFTVTIRDEKGWRQETA